MIPKHLALGVLCLVVFSSSSSSSSPSSSGEEERRPRLPPPDHINIILVGATGDLAGKYLWKGLFSLFKHQHQKGKLHFSIYGCGRNAPAEGRQTLSRMLLHATTCYDDECRQIKTEFIQIVQYHQLKTEKDYKALGSKITENTLNLYGLETNQTSYETGRLFYLAIPPSGLSKAVQHLHSHLMPQAGHPWVRLVIEKPFGHDKKSAEKLAAKLNRHFKEEQIYRVDHYLGKPVVRLILPFRYINRATYEPLWNREHVERVEVVMKETLDCTGRYKFYDKVGVLRDVVQNHLMELTALVAMDLPHNSGNISEILAKKLELLRQVAPLGPESTLVGQYAGYSDGLQQELEDLDRSSNTPTFSASVLYINNARWGNVPFILVSGKKLDEKSSYVRLVFKDSLFCMDKLGKECHKQKQIVFDISNDDLYRPSLILTSPGLPQPGDYQGWQREDLRLNVSVHGENMAQMTQLLAVSEHEAYDVIISGVVSGERHLFTPMDGLMAAWNLWTPVLEDAVRRQPRLYQGRDVDPSWLSFQVKGGTLEYVHADLDEELTAGAGGAVPRVAQVPGVLLGRPLVSGDLQEVVSRLAGDMYRAALEAVAERGAFHVAFSGGHGPGELFKHLTQSYQTLFPWQHTHVWQVDERCVNADSVHSNFGVLERDLLEHVHLAHSHVHPMPVLLQGEPCQQEDDGAAIYEWSLRRGVAGGRLDFTLLGVGMDGHTASLFAGQPSLHERERLVVYTDGGPPTTATRRITLTWPAINTSRRVGVLVLGRGKHDILSKVTSDSGHTLDEYPILGVAPSNGTLTFYVDHDALIGD